MRAPFARAPPFGHEKATRRWLRGVMHPVNASTVVLRSTGRRGLDFWSSRKLKSQEPLNG
ncbi:hypothetical protein D9M68_474050 [compost metagenome]